MSGLVQAGTAVEGSKLTFLSNASPLSDPRGAGALATSTIYSPASQQRSLARWVRAFPFGFISWPNDVTLPPWDAHTRRSDPGPERFPRGTFTTALWRRRALRALCELTEFGTMQSLRAPVSASQLRPFASSSRASRVAAVPRSLSRLLPAAASPLLRSQLSPRAILRRSPARSLGSVSVHAKIAGDKPKTAKEPSAFIPKNLHGFEVLRSEYISEYDAVAVLYKHKKTGAEVRLRSVGCPCGRRSS